LALGWLLACGPATAQTLYKYQGEDGEWIYSDRPPGDGRSAESRTINEGLRRDSVEISDEFIGSGLLFTASNRFHAPVEVGLEFESIAGVDFPHPDDDLRWIVPARSTLELLELSALGDVDVPAVSYRWFYLPGDPDSEPSAGQTYRLPYSVGTRYTVSQTYPESLTHLTRDSMYAVDFAMPVGTNVVAARDGIVFDVASTNFRGGPDADRYADLANLVRVLHDDGTFAVYAHLNWNTIRVRPGDRVSAGQYIADSGNTGFSTGPHLHFAVQRNLGMRVESIPVTFRGSNAAPVTPTTGAELTAHP
jgi:murein DD-endopeptidase MepM/ murein hydrolase activator NlpD